MISGESSWGNVRADWDESYLDEFNKILHANIMKVEQQAYVVPNYRAWFLEWKWKLSAWFTVDGEKTLINPMSALSESDPYTLERLRQGFTNTFTIEYEVGDKIDISAGNFIDSPVNEINFLTTSIESFKNNMVPLNAYNILKDLALIVKPEWLSFKEAILLETNKEVDQDLLQGRLCAGQYTIKATVEASTEGTENNVVGEMTFFMTLKFEYGDLNLYNNQKVAISESRYDWLTETVFGGIADLRWERPLIKIPLLF